MRNIFIISILLLSFNFEQALGFDGSAEKVVKVYVEEQFRGKSDWLVERYVKFTKIYDTYLNENLKEGVEYDFRYQPFYAVNKYNIDHVSVTKEGYGKALVTYYNVAEGFVTKEAGKRVVDIKRPQKAVEQVNLNLRIENGKWYIIDPPFPRISVTAVVAKYDDYFRVRNLQSNPEKVIKEKTASFYVYRAYKHLIELINMARKGNP